MNGSILSSAGAITHSESRAKDIIICVKQQQAASRPPQASPFEPVHLGCAAGRKDRARWLYNAKTKYNPVRTINDALATARDGANGSLTVDFSL